MIFDTQIFIPRAQIESGKQIMNILRKSAINEKTTTTKILRDRWKLQNLTTISA